MVKLMFLCGVQGSGKSTFAKTQRVLINGEIVATDGIRKKYPELEEKDVFPKAYEVATDYLNNGTSVIFDATNITKDVRINNLTNILKNVKVEVETSIVVFRINKEECKRRVNIRNSLPGEFFIPLEVIDDYYNKFEPVGEEEGFNNVYIIE